MKDKRGIVLVTALITVLVIVMFLTSALILMPGGLNATRDSVENEMARRAADSGMRYARLRMREDENWRGGADGQVLVVNEGPDKMVVVEDTGNVVGYLRNPDGTLGQFRIRFNYQDGGGGGDGRNDPGASMMVDHEYVSTNNLTGNTGVDIPVVDVSTWQVTGSGPRIVPPNRAHVIVEGRAGPGLNGVNQGDPNAATNGRTVSSYVEAFFQKNNAGRVNAVMSAGGEIDVTLSGGGEVILDSADISKGPLMQGNQSVDALGGGSPNVVRSNADGAGNGKGKGKGKGKNDKKGPSVAPGEVKYSAAETVDEGPGINVSQDASGPSYLDLQWSEITTATATDATISGGTYVLYGNQLYHYDRQYLEVIPGVPGVPANPGDPNAVPPIPPTPAVPPVPASTWTPPTAPDASATLVPNDFGTGSSSITWGMENNVTGQGVGATKHTGVGININDNVLVTPSTNGVDSIAFVNGDPAKTSDDVMLRFDPPQDVAILSTPGDFWIKGKIEGTGVAITAEGAINMEGAGFNLLVEPNADTTLNLYAQGDINISSYNEKNGDYGDISANGIIYTWSDFNADLGGDGVFYLSGAMEALGAVPGSGTGGVSGGNINIDASEVYLGYDSAYLDALLKVRENNLQMTMYKRF